MVASWRATVLLCLLALAAGAPISGDRVLIITNSAATGFSL
jgi:hypothetical protein